jgi:hypothetical protein
MARYTPGIVDDQIVGDELQKIAQAMDTADQMLMLEMIYAAPTKFRVGAVVLADGTAWNPGSGAGVYCYYGSAWVKLG